MSILPTQPQTLIIGIIPTTSITFILPIDFIILRINIFQTCHDYNIRNPFLVFHLNHLQYIKLSKILLSLSVCFYYNNPPRHILSLSKTFSNFIFCLLPISVISKRYFSNQVAVAPNCI